MTLDELLKLHPLPWRIVEDWPGFNVHDADGLPVDDTRPEAQAVCDAMSELVRLRESSMVQTHLRMAEKLEKAEAELATLRARNAELERDVVRFNKAASNAAARECYAACAKERDVMKMRLADLIEDGNIDDILGKAEPCLDDVREEARRVFGEGVTVAEYAGFVSVEYVASDRLDPVSAPTIASAYACLRALPSKVTK